MTTDATTSLRWGILSTGRIAHAFASHLPASRTGRLVAVASRATEPAEAFAAECRAAHGEVRAHGSYAALLADPEVEAIYLATPHPQHAEWLVKAARAGKHVLCEKPLAVNFADAEAALAEAAASGVTVREAFMYRCHPQTAAIAEAIRGGKIGDVRLIEAVFSFDVGETRTGRLVENDAAGGGILDVGCYTMNLARSLAGAARGEPFAEPRGLAGQAFVGDTGVDEWAIADADFGGGLLAQLRCGVRLKQDGPQLRVTGSAGSLVAEQVFIPAREGGEAGFDLTTDAGTERVTAASERALYGLEADAFAAAVAGEASPLPTPADTLGNMAALDRWRDAVGLRYGIETPAKYRSTRVGGEPLAAGSRIPSVTLAGVAGRVSRLVLGCDNKNHLAELAPVADAYWAAGGNAFDTAQVYGKPRSKALGDWLAHRGVAAEAHVICKGAHSPRCHPSQVGVELDLQLGWLGLDACSFYFLHRDNPEVPVGEFVDAVDELASAGKITGLSGGSNWSLQRVKEANAYAAANGRRAFTAVSQNLSLAVMVDPIWGGCVTAHQPDWLAWLEETQTPNFAWSSQARGFFAAGRDLDEAEVKRCWVSEDNLERKRRAVELAEKKGCDAINVAGAWVLRQPFPSFALIGPRQVSELHSTLATLDVTLTDEEVAWLDLR
ncbi:aldo/keto reductase [Phycisphaera mikurensis]|uniref:Putative oxidoreductase n=1 Tax=Phycisphaera mikurensis (strain NBRC 102666 / KCTC 22515 / FYK2301M01) TaxID=1142394 RepID=I0IG16_PHYMF|nr:aldo/keto reductase [Phycisphaera mikurensis]MBB6440411.1 putative dehydrogenase/aryl-alcohol dehydrogenase-like putative oxidoreductase [Phycisphaera mikurensis]BAM04204.1 putative oxidoreductase [Phycisphaera mikurensis NBRC 102666]